MQVFQVLKLFALLKITKNSTWYLLNLALKNVFYGNQIMTLKPAMWILSDEFIKHSKRKNRTFIKFLIDLGRIALFYYQNLFLLTTWFYIKMKTQASILNSTFQLMLTRISQEFTKLVNSHRLSLKIRGGEQICVPIWYRNIYVPIWWKEISYKLAGRLIRTQKKASKKKYNYWQQKVEKCCHHYWLSLLSIMTMDLRDRGISWQNKKENIINSLLYTKLLISNPFVISFLHVCFYVQYPIFCLFLAG